MKKSIAILCFMSALATLGTGCADSVKDETPSTDCLEGATKCLSTSTVSECQNGTWTEIPCPASHTCNTETKRCEPVTTPTPTGLEPEPGTPTAVCNEGVSECIGSANSRKCVGGQWVNTTCQSNEGCKNGVCTEITDPNPTDDCTTGDKECIDNTHARHCKSGRWEEQTCESNESCQSGDCKPSGSQEPEKCTDGAIECVNNGKERICVGGDWQENACDNNETCQKDGCTPNPVQPEEVLTTGTLADVGKKCSLDNFTDSCENNQIIYCNAEGRIESSNTCDLWLEYSFVDMRCHVINGMAGCVYYDEDGTPDTCQTPSDTISCSKDGKKAYHKGCGKAEDGNLYVMGEYEFSETCPMECREGVGCVEIPEDERCDVATHVDSCSNNSIVSCVNGRKIETSCGDKTCHVFAALGTAQCTDTTCDQSGESIACRYETDSENETRAFADTYTCAKAEDKKYYQFKTKDEYCSYDCWDEIGCVPALKGEGDECNENTYEEQCRDGAYYSATLSCIGGFVEAVYCGKGKTCLNEMDSPTYVTGCYDDSSICQKGDASYGVCSGSGNYFSVMTYECKPMSDKKYHYTPNTDTIKSCSKGCNDAGNGCK